MTTVFTGVSEDCQSRIEEDVSGECVWASDRVYDFLEKNLGLSQDHKIPGRIVTGHNESLLFWKQLIEGKKLSTPFEVVHVDSHADLGLGYSSHKYISDVMLRFDPIRRLTLLPGYDENGKEIRIGIGDYLLFAIAFRWISKLTYCANPNGDCNDYLWFTMKDLDDNPYIWDHAEKIIQLISNQKDDLPNWDDPKKIKQKYLSECIKEPEVPFEIIHTIDGVRYNGDFDFAVMAQSPNYTPESTDFIMDIFREYINEI